MLLPKLKIVYIIYGDLKNKTGNIIHALEITKAWAKQGHIVTLIIPKFGITTERIQANIITIPTGFKGMLGLVIFSVLLTLYLMYLIIQKRVNIVYVMEMSFVFWAFLICKIAKIPYIIEVHAIAINEIKLQKSNYLKKYLKQLIMVLIEKLNFYNSDLIIAVSEHIASFIHKFFNISKDKIVVISNGVDIHTYRPMNTLECRKDLGIPLNAKVIGYIGSFFSYNHVDILVKIAPIILSIIPNAYFVLVGNGPCRNEIEQIIKRKNLKNKFLIVDFVDSNLCAKYINTFDIGIGFHDPDYGGFPMKFLNYIACGKPVVGTNSPGVQYISKYRLGILVDLKDIDQIIGAIVKLLLSNEYKTSEFICRSRKIVVKFYSWDAKAQEIIFQFLKLIKYQNKIGNNYETI